MSSAPSLKQAEARVDYLAAETTASPSRESQPDAPAEQHPGHRKRSISFPTDLPKADHASDATAGRKSSASSFSFRRPQNPALPQGNQRQTDGSRIRAISPPYHR